jgi:chromosome segregation ATPase
MTSRDPRIDLLDRYLDVTEEHATECDVRTEEEMQAVYDALYSLEADRNQLKKDLAEARDEIAFYKQHSRDLVEELGKARTELTQTKMDLGYWSGLVTEERERVERLRDEIAKYKADLHAAIDREHRADYYLGEIIKFAKDPYHKNHETLVNGAVTVQTLAQLALSINLRRDQQSAADDPSLIGRARAVAVQPALDQMRAIDDGYPHVETADVPVQHP